MDDFDLERDLEDAGIDAFEFSLMDEDERRQTLEDAFLDPDMYMDADLDPGFDAWEQLQSAGLGLSELDFMDEDERRETLESAGLNPSDYGSLTDFSVPSVPTQSSPLSSVPPNTPSSQEYGSKPKPSPMI